MWRWLCQYMPGINTLVHYQARFLKADIRSGLSVAAVALPVGIAYADLAGVPAVYGIYSATFPLFAYALFGSSKQLMVGPDAATCIIVAASLGHLAAGDGAKYQALMLLLTLLTAGIYIIAGVFKLGFIANFLSLPILTGFLNGIALVIALGQIKKLLGIHIESTGVLSELSLLVGKLAQTHAPTFWLALSLIALLYAIKYLFPKLPSALMTIIFSMALVKQLNLQELNVATLGQVPSGIPEFNLFIHVNVAEFKVLLVDALALALISFTSGILTAKSFAQRNGYEVNANQELIAYGVSNLASGIAQGFPVTGADSRTAINHEMHGKTQMVGVIAGVSMLLVLFLTEPLALIPLSALAAVILVAAMSLFDFRTLKELYQMNKTEFVLSVLTTLGVLTLGVLPGVVLAIALSLCWLLAVDSKPSSAILGRVSHLKSYHNIEDFPDAKQTPGILCYRFEANLLFFNADYFKQDVLNKLAQHQQQHKPPIKWLIIDASSINIVDATGAHKILELQQQLKKQQIELYITNKKQSVQRFFANSWLKDKQHKQKLYMYPTLKLAERAFIAKQKQKQDNSNIIEHSNVEKGTSDADGTEQKPQTFKRFDEI